MKKQTHCGSFIHQEMCHQVLFIRRNVALFQLFSSLIISPFTSAWTAEEQSAVCEHAAAGASAAGSRPFRGAGHVSHPQRFTLRI